MSWKDLKRFWRKDANTNQLISEAYEESRPLGALGFSMTEASAIGYAIIESASTRPDTADTIHLLVGSYSVGPSYFLSILLGKFGYKNQRVVAVVPKFLHSGIKKQLKEPKEPELITVLRNTDYDLKKIKGTELASVFVYSYEYMFNWEHYGLDLAPGGYVIFTGVKLPLSRFYTLSGWDLKGKYSSLFFVKRGKVDENRSNDTDQGTQPESTGKVIQDTKE